MKQIKYKTFVKRKNFSIISWIRKSKEKTYESLSAFLSSKNIIPPGKEYWEKAINFYNDSLVNEANAHVNTTDDITDVKATEKTSSESLDKKNMIISVMKEKIKKDALSKTSSSKSKRKRRRKSNTENITE